MSFYNIPSSPIQGAGTGFNLGEKPKSSPYTSGFGSGSNYGSYNDTTYSAPPASPSLTRARGYMTSHLFPEKNSVEEEPQNQGFRDQTNWSSPVVNRTMSNEKFTPNIPQGPPARNEKKDDSTAPPVLSIYDGDLPLESNSDERNGIAPSRVDPIPRQAYVAAPKESIFRDDVNRGEGQEIIDERWVTVYGFPQTSFSKVLRAFQKYGDIVRYKSEEGNWVHIQYQTRLQAQKALTKNGKIIETGVMIGVLPYNAKRVASAGRELNPSTILAPRLQQLHLTPSNSHYAVEQAGPQTMPVAYPSMWTKVKEYLVG